jgi:hypothetical protein
MKLNFFRKFSVEPSGAGDGEGVVDRSREHVVKVEPGRGLRHAQRIGHVVVDPGLADQQPVVIRVRYLVRLAGSLVSAAHSRAKSHRSSVRVGRTNHVVDHVDGQAGPAGVDVAL